MSHLIVSGIPDLSQAVAMLLVALASVLSAGALRNSQKTRCRRPRTKKRHQ